jgi:XisH protein
MSRKDQFHDAVKRALEKDGWVITHDPFTIQISEAVKLKIDLGAESTIGAQRGQEKIAIEIKSFITDSDISEFHGALGQYLNYIQALEDKEPDRTLHLAVPLETYDDFFQLPFIQTSLKRHGINLLIYEPIQEEIKSWISYNNTAK